MTRVRDLSPDPNRPRVADIVARTLEFKDTLSLSFTAALAEEASTTLTYPLRIQEVEVAAMTSGSLGVQVQVDGVDLFDDSDRPLSGETKEPVLRHLHFPGSLLKVIVELSFAPVGDGLINIRVKPHTLLPRTDQREPHGRDRLRLSTRREFEDANRGIDVSPLFPKAKTVTYPIHPGAVGPGRNIRQVRLRDEDVYYRTR